MRSGRRLLPCAAFQRTWPRTPGGEPAVLGISRPPSAIRAAQPPPVVLVHGFAGSSTTWFDVRRALRADGRTVVSFGYRPWASMDELADRLIETVEDVLAATGAGTVHLVGHSLGA